MMDKENISNLIYHKLSVATCGNCRYSKEYSDFPNRVLEACTDCRNKERSGWGISEAVADWLANKICE